MDIGETSSRRGSGVAALVCICLLGIVLLGVLATIVLSLIPIYLPTRAVSSISTRSSGPQQVSFALPSNYNLAAGSSLTTSNRAGLQNQMQAAFAGNSNFNGLATVNVINGVLANSGKRKRRQSTVIPNIVIVTYELLFTNNCLWITCQTRVINLARSTYVGLQINLLDISPSASATSASATSASTASASASSTTTPSVSADQVTGDISLISEYWGNLRPYSDNPANYFGVNDTGLPAGCQIEQAHVLHRHASRYPADTDYARIVAFAQKVTPAQGGFTGPLSFLNSWSQRLGTNSLLPQGRNEEYASGVKFWTKYGRILYQATSGQPTYNETGQTKPLLRCNSVGRVMDSARSWAEGFFGLYNATSKYTLLVIPTTNPNNSLASYISCTNYANDSYGLFDNYHQITYGPLPFYLTNATARLSAYAPSGFSLNVNDTFIMQLLCVYEYVALESSDFCSLFTVNEWKGFDYVNDLFLYDGFSFGQPAGRALGVGYLEELIARLKHQQITVSDSSVNSTLDSSSDTFPLDQLFYLDMAHDFTVVGLLTALSIDYFRQDLPYNTFPPPDRHFRSAHLTPYAARFITEKIACTSSNPTATNSTNTQYTPGQYGYSASSASFKFIRMRLNDGIVPLNTIQGGQCAIAGRTDGLCPLDNFLASQANASVVANYGFVCLGSYVYNSTAFTGNGTFFANA